MATTLGPKSLLRSPSGPRACFFLFLKGSEFYTFALQPMYFVQGLQFNEISRVPVSTGLFVIAVIVTVSVTITTMRSYYYF